jgi:hypothetical protein
MSFEIRSDEVDVEEIMRLIRQRIEEKKRGLYTDDEIRRIAEHRLEAVLDAHEFASDLLADFDGETRRWEFQFPADAIYRSSRGFAGQLLERIRGLLKPIQKLFWNPNVMIAAISRLADINRERNDLHVCYVHLLHNFALETTRLNLEVQALKNRVLELHGRLEQQVRREKTLEDMVVYRAEPATPPGADTPGGEQSA